MPIISREFYICSRCMTECQHYELDDEGNMSTNDWLAIATNPDRKGYHLCPACKNSFYTFMMGFENIPAVNKAVDPELKDHQSNYQYPVGE